MQAPRPPEPSGLTSEQEFRNLPSGPRLSLRRLLVMIALIAVGCAFLPWMLAILFAAFVLFWGFSSGRKNWRVIEQSASGAWLVGAVIAFSDASLASPLSALLILAGPVLAISWLLRSLFRPDRDDWRPFLFTPLCGLLGLILFVTDVDFQIRLALSQHALERCARSVPIGEYTRDPQVAGLFWVHHIEGKPGATLFHTGGFIDEDGVAYVPSQVPPSISTRYQFRRIRGPWFRYQYYW